MTAVPDPSRALYPVYTGHTCECCWTDRALHLFGGGGDTYYDAMRRHEAAGCPCTRPDIDGARRRSGQFWNEESGRDSRPRPEPVESTNKPVLP